MPRKNIHHYLYFTRKERRGSLLLLIIIVILSLSPFLYALFYHNNISSPTEFDEQLAALKAKQVNASKKYDNSKSKEEDDDARPFDAPSAGNYSSSQTKGSLFYFDPNTLSAEGWKQLGLREKTIATIRNYIAKGGKFSQPDDIRKIWGLFPDQAERLVPYVQITNTSTTSSAPVNKVGGPVAKSAESKKMPAPISINESDSSDWIALPGIGSTFSRRIINFRDKLGGFYTIEQVGETFGLSDSTFQKIKPLLLLTGEVKKLNLNSATFEDLKAHPYIRYQLANALVQYKTQHGEYKSVEDIKRIMIVTEELFNKVSPYLTVD